MNRKARRSQKKFSDWRLITAKRHKYSKAKKDRFQTKGSAFLNVIKVKRNRSLMKTWLIFIGLVIVVSFALWLWL